MNYSNVMSTLAVFLVVTGGTALAAALPESSVKSKTVKDNSLKSIDLADGEAVTGTDVADGSLTGTDVADGTLTGADVGEATLGQVPAATLGGLGRSASDGSCDPESSTFETCVSVALTLPSATRVLLTGTTKGSTEPDSDRGVGQCRLGTSSTGGLAGTSKLVLSDDDDELAAIGGDVTMTAVSPVVGPGNVSFGIDCNQSPNLGAITYTDSQISAVAISPN